MKKHVLAVVILACSVFTVSCTQRILEFTIVSTRNIDLSRVGEFTRSNRVARGRDIVHWIIIFPTSFTGQPQLMPAIERAIRSVPGCVALIDGRVSESSWWFIYGQDSYIVEGTPLIDPKLSMIPPGSHMVTSMGPVGNVKETRVVSQSEYEALKKRHRQPGGIVGLNVRP
jgi:hypothetical protein